MTLHAIWKAPASLVVFTTPLVMDRQAFDSLAKLAGDDVFEAPGGDIRKALIGTGGVAAWHAISRMDHCDRAFFTARPISVRVYQSED